ncbi:hypothetical protein QYE76_062544 [Lolium multiflorum]|uniref:Ribonuclease H1 N-terminal domain-containing protein n=1 Tax=Lolium multiflorum TaxID=4521 RepID=A0AAD8S3T0_LOLMU|nr:hypothetical protein QYE76_062544 [Lolium multiflorum]
MEMPTTYVVYKGRVPGVYDDWEDCRRQVHRFSGNSYKGYPTRVEAEGRYARYLAGEMRDMRRNRMKTMAFVMMVIVTMLNFRILLPAHLNDLLPAHVACASAASTTAGAAAGAPVELALCRRIYQGAPAVHDLSPAHRLVRRQWPVITGPFAAAGSWCAGNGTFRCAGNRPFPCSDPDTLPEREITAGGLYIAMSSSEVMRE